MPYFELQIAAAANLLNVAYHSSTEATVKLDYGGRQLARSG